MLKHHVRIWVDDRGTGCRMEIDGKEVYGVVAIDVELAQDAGPRVSVELVPRVLEIEGAATVEGAREVVFVERATAERR